MSHEATEAEEFEVDLNVLSDEELVEFETALAADYAAKRGLEDLSAEDFSDLKEISATLKVVRAAMVEREELAAADDVVAEAKGADFLAKVKARKDAAAKAEADAAKAAEKVEAKTEVEPVAQATEVEVEVEPAAKAAVAAKAEAPAVVISPTGLEGDKAPAAKATGIVAAAATKRYSQGSELPDFSAVAQAFVENRRSASSSGREADGGRVLVASVYGDFDESRTLTNDLDANMAKINAVTSPAALAASGGICAMNTPYYDLTLYGDAHRPVRDVFPVYKADRGGIRFMPAPQISDLAGSVRRTTAAQDAAGYTNQSPAGSTAPKPCLHVTCEGEQSCIIQAVSRCLTFGNMGARTYPEQVEAWIKLGMVEFARYTEIELLNAVSAASTAISAEQLYGATVSLLEQVSVITTAFRARHRLASTRTLRALMPFWVTEIIRTDIAAQAYGDQLERLSVSDAQIAAWFSARGVNVTFYQDNTTAAGVPFATQTAGTLLSWPDSVEWFVFPEGAFLYLDGGNLDLGMVRDSTLNSQNDYQIFYEEFFGLCFIGIDSYKVTSTICPNGASVNQGTVSNLRTCTHAGS